MRHRLYGGVRGRCCNAPLYSIKNWPLALNQFEILYGDSGYDLVTKII
ncbi:hypothetical protein [Candidatus Bandiella numerosa]|nr:hypothetical protein [Candidatus Bandiella numerosa]